MTLYHVLFMYASSFLGFWLRTYVENIVMNMDITMPLLCYIIECNVISC